MKWYWIQEDKAKNGSQFMTSTQLSCYIIHVLQSNFKKKNYDWHLNVIKFYQKMKKMLPYNKSLEYFLKW